MERQQITLSGLSNHLVQLMILKFLLQRFLILITQAFIINQVLGILLQTQVAHWSLLDQTFILMFIRMTVPQLAFHHYQTFLFQILGLLGQV